MKTIEKILYIIFGSALMLSSCSQEEAPIYRTDGSDRMIVFHTSLPEVTTKATEIVSDLLNFNLTAFDENELQNGNLKEYINNQTLWFNTNGNYSSDDCVWPEDEGKEDDLLHFFAYYPSLQSMKNSIDKDNKDKFKLAKNYDNNTLEYRLEDFQISSDIANQVDFVTAYNTGSMANNLFSGVDLEFRHQLSRIEVKAKGEHKSCDIEIAGVSIRNAVMQGTFEFQKSDADGVWSDILKDNATYIFRQGDAIVTVGADPVSIIGSKVDEYNDNCAMLIPSVLDAWANTTDVSNTNKGLYLNVLLRIIDKTPTGKGKQQYPYYDNSQGLNALNIPIVLFPVDNDGKIKGDPIQVYKGEYGVYYTDVDKTHTYTPSDPVKEFGWAAIPISGNWEPGKIYTYTLDYSYGVGVHGPETPGEESPKAGDPIISDRVGVSLVFTDWTKASNTGIEVPGN